jgi:MFS family permease
VESTAELETGAIAPSIPEREAAAVHHVHLRELRQRVQIEAASWGILSSINGSLVSPLLVSRGAGPVALGIYNSLANLLGYSAGFGGPQIAQKLKSTSRTALLCVGIGRLVFLAVPLALLAVSGGGVPLFMSLILVWALGEGLALPLWTSFVAGLATTEDRGRWLAMRGTAATGASAAVMIAVFILLRSFSQDTAFPLAYGFAAVGGVISWFQVRLLFASTTTPPLPPMKKAQSLPTSPEARRFLGSVVFFWFGAGLIWPVLPPFIINELHAPTSYFAAVAIIASLSSFVVQRRWGRIADRQGPTRMFFLAGIGTAVVPAFWALTPVYWIGLAIEVVASASWPGHMLGLTIRSVDLAENEASRPQMLAWTSLAQGAGASISPLVASVLVAYTGTIPILIVASIFRLVATCLLGGISLRRLRLPVIGT